MEFNVKWLDLSNLIAAQTMPVGLLKRKRNHAGDKPWSGTTEIAFVGEYWTLDAPLFGAQPPGMSVTIIGEVVRIPMFAYRTQYRSLASIFGLGLQIGVASVAELRKYTSDVPTTAHLVLGSDCTDLGPGEDGYRCYVGISLQTK